MDINATSIIYLFGAGQALLLIIGINYKQPLASTAKLMTSILLLVMLILMLYYTVLLNELNIFYPYYIYSLGSAAWMAITPAYYLTLKSIREPKWEATWKQLLYFPISLVFLAELLLTGIGLPAWLYLLVNDNRLFLDIWMASFFLSGFYFVGKTIRQQHQPAQLDKNRVLRWFSYAFMLVLTVFAGIYLLVRKDYVSWFELTLVVLCELFVFILVFKTFKSISLRHFFDATKYDNQELCPVRMRNQDQDYKKRQCLCEADKKY